VAGVERSEPPATGSVTRCAAVAVDDDPLLGNPAVAPGDYSLISQKMTVVRLSISRYTLTGRVAKRVIAFAKTAKIEA